MVSVTRNFRHFTRKLDKNLIHKIHLMNNELSNKPFISVVLCSYNREETISQTIESILSQKVNLVFELIIGDDGSKDSSSHPFFRADGSIDN